MERQNRINRRGALRAARQDISFGRIGRCRNDDDRWIDFDGPFDGECADGQDYALLTAGGDLRLAANAPVLFDSQFGAAEQNCADVNEPGIYYASYTLNIPSAAEEIDLALYLGNRTLRDSHLHVPASNAPVCATIQVMFRACGETSLQLRTMNPLTLTSDSRTPAVTLSMFRIA